MIKGIGNNTRIEDRYGETAVVLHGTPVVKVKRVNAQFNNALDGSVLIEGKGSGLGIWTITLNSGGYRTATTKRRMNQAFQEFGYNARVFSKNFDLFCQFQDKLYAFKGDILKIPLN